MKIRICIGGDESRVIVLPLDCAGVAAELLAKAAVYDRDGYYSTSGWKLAEKGITISYTDCAELEPTHPKVLEAQKAADDKQTQWYKEYTARQAAEKKLAETEAALAALQAVTVCSTNVVPETESAPDVDEYSEQGESV